MLTFMITYYISNLVYMDNFNARVHDDKSGCKWDYITSKGPIEIGPSLARNQGPLVSMIGNQLILISNQFIHKFVKFYQFAFNED